MVHSLVPHLRATQPITLAEIVTRGNIIHHDRALFAKTLFTPFRINATNLLLVDQNGDPMMLSLYNFVRPQQDPADLFPDGSFVALVEPYCKFSRDDPKAGQLMLRCDNPEACVLFKTVEEWLSALQSLSSTPLSSVLSTTSTATSDTSLSADSLHLQ